MTLGTDYSIRLKAIAKGIQSLGIDRRDPSRFLEEKDTLAHQAERLASAIEIDQVFAGRPALADVASQFDRAPRTVHDRRGRPVRVETRGRFAVARS